MTLPIEDRDVGITQAESLETGDVGTGSEAFRGYVDVYGYHTMAEGWFFAGWMTRRDGLAERLNEAVALFGDETLAAPVASLFFSRDDISAQGVGFLVFFRADDLTRSRFDGLRIDIDGVVETIIPVEPASLLPESQLIRRLGFIVSLSEDAPPRRAMAQLLDGEAGTNGAGYIEYYGYHELAGGWFFSGWVSRPWADRQTPDRVLASFEDGDLRGEVIAALFARGELEDGAAGAVFFIAAGPASFGAFVNLSLLIGGVRTVLQPTVAAPALRDAALLDRLRANLSLARPGLARDRLNNLVARLPFNGEDTLEAMAPDIFLYIDEAIACGPEGLLLLGWTLSKPGEVAQIRVRSGNRTTPLVLRDCVRIDRHDVIDGFAKYGYDEIASGFVAYLPAAMDSEGPLYIEVENQRLETGFRNIPRPAASGMAAIRKLLSVVDVRFADMRQAFDRVLGPAVEALNRARLATAVEIQVVEYGVMPKAPKFSVIVPVHGRLDFVEYQLALFSARPEAAEVEFIYVLDDPPKRREAQILFTSVYERFLIPFRAILLDRNLGFAPANNIGLRHAHGEFVAYLNSDVFPGTLDWLERLSDQLVDDPKLGVIGPLLLFEDGSVQHRGMYFERLAEFGDWYFCQHQDKGLRYHGGHDLQHFIAITGACMVLRRDLAVAAGGFDEVFVLGDFEDADLCLKLQAMGYQCAVDPDVRLYHLERKSQASGALNWRANLTAYNAWQHERRWTATIAEKQGHAFGGRA